MNQVAAMRYTGTLYFDDGDPVEVRALIVRNDRVSFDLIGGWGEHGKWARSGIAKKVGPVFHSEFAPSNQAGVEGYPCKIIFSSVAGGEVVGAWVEQGEERTFSGSLESG